MIQDTKIEFCVIAAYDDGNNYCIAKFMHEEDARRYKRTRKKKEYVRYRLYERRECREGVTWTELE